MATFTESGIEKAILHAGNGKSPDYRDGMKVTFHFCTKKQDAQQTIVDDSRLMAKPMELILGKKFKLEVWEACVRTMHVGELASFKVDKSLVDSYPWVSKTLRSALGNHKDQDNHQESTSHCCGVMGMKGQGLGHSDLDELLHEPQPLTFIIELLKAQEPEEYEQEAWAMTDNEKLDSIPKLREDGNSLYQKKMYEEAAQKYFEALGRIEHLIIREKPGAEEWNVLNDMKVPLLLNYSQCKLILADYYPVIEHTTTVLEREPDNLKALFRRAKANIGAWNPEDARKDLLRVMQLDPTLSSAVGKEIQHIDQLQRQKDHDDAIKLKGKLF